ncbi:MAG: phospholipase D family protein [Pseudobdellovibrionaceae bacterium]
MIQFRIFLLFLFLVACTSLPSDPQRVTSQALSPDPHSRIAQELKKRQLIDPEKSSFRALASGQDALLARLVSAAAADHSLDLQYYIWSNDQSGLLVLKYVLDAADRGVRVRLLLDDLNQGQFQKFLAVFATHPQIEVRLANPLPDRGGIWKNTFKYSQINRRMHNKVFIADNLVGIVGGRNIGDEYFGSSQELNYGDFDLWAAGPVVPELSKEFDLYWNSEISFPIESLMPDFHPTPKDLTELRQNLAKKAEEAKNSMYQVTVQKIIEGQLFSKDNSQIYWGRAQVMTDPPEKLDQEKSKEEVTLRHELDFLVQELKNELILVSPYFVPENRTFEFFMKMKKKGVKTVVITNSLASSDVATVFAGYKVSRKDLLEAGVDLYEVKAKATNQIAKSERVGSTGSRSGLHGKVFIFDRKKIFVGSMNLDPRSLYLNSEMGVVVDCPELASAFAQKMDEGLPQAAYHLQVREDRLVWQTLEKGRKTEYDKEPETTWWQRFKAGAMSIVVPKSQL